MKQLSFDAALDAAPRPARCRNHDFPGLRPSASCIDCRAQYAWTHRHQSWQQRCPGARQITDQATVLSRTPDWKATSVCPVCSKTVRASRPTKMVPWTVVGMHN